MGEKTVNLIPSFLPNEAPTELDKLCFRVFEEDRKREELLQRLFPKTRAARGQDYDGGEDSLPAMLCDELKQILPASGLTTKEEITESINDFLEIHEEEARTQFQSAAERVSEGKLTADELKEAIADNEKRGRFNREARRTLTNGNELQIFEDVQNTLQWAVCSVYASLEDWETYKALLAQARLIAEIDFPHCAKQKGGNRKLEKRDEFSKTIPEAVRLAGGVEAWKRLTLTNQIRFLQDASEKYRAKGVVSFSTAKNWIERATECGLLDLVPNEKTILQS